MVYETDHSMVADATIMRIRVTYITEATRLRRLGKAIKCAPVVCALNLMRFDDGRPQFNINYREPSWGMTLIDRTKLIIVDDDEYEQYVQSVPFFQSPYDQLSTTDDSQNLQTDRDAFLR